MRVLPLVLGLTFAAALVIATPALAAGDDAAPGDEGDVDLDKLSAETIQALLQAGMPNTVFVGQGFATMAVRSVTETDVSGVITSFTQPKSASADMQLFVQRAPIAFRAPRSAIVRVRKGGAGAAP
jgi:hypothetical protein